jgi:thiamine biosynthesis lipoprotein
MQRFSLVWCLVGWLFLAKSVAQPVDTFRRFEYAHPQMGTVVRLVFYAKADSAAAGFWAMAAFRLVDSLNASMSDYLPESEISRLGILSDSGQSMVVTQDLWKILILADGFSRQSGGAFDVTIGALTRLWRRARNLKELPDSSRVVQARQSVGYQNLLFEADRHIRLSKPGMRIDLGGIAQGYAADRCLEVLRSFGVRRALADVGGDIALGDPPPGKEGWEIVVPGENRQVMVLKHCGITTSGATHRFLEANGKRYSHIVDPRTGWALTHRVLVTVKAPNAVIADAWATAISVLGKSGWQTLKRKPKRVKVWLTEEKW